MKWYFIYAYPATYGGLHGMYNYDLIECQDYQEVCEYGYELANETIDSYLRADEIYSTEDYMNDYYNGAEWDDRYHEDYWDTFEEVKQEECAFEVYLLKDEYTYEDYQTWQKENMEPRDFIERYCRQLTEKDYI